MLNSEQNQEDSIKFSERERKREERWSSVETFKLLIQIDWSKWKEKREITD